VSPDNCCPASEKYFREIPASSRCGGEPPEMLEVGSLILQKELRGAGAYYLTLNLARHFENHFEDLVVEPCSLDWIFGGECKRDVGAWRSVSQMSLFCSFLHRSALHVDVQVRPESKCLNINRLNF
jgi:hypothetical protein